MSLYLEAARSSLRAESLVIDTTPRRFRKRPVPHRKRLLSRWRCVTGPFVVLAEPPIRSVEPAGYRDGQFAPVVGAVGTRRVHPPPVEVAAEETPASDKFHLAGVARGLGAVSDRLAYHSRARVRARGRRTRRDAVEIRTFMSVGTRTHYRNDASSGARRTNKNISCSAVLVLQQLQSR